MTFYFSIALIAAFIGYIIVFIQNEDWADRALYCIMATLAGVLWILLILPAAAYIVYRLLPRSMTNRY